VQIDVVILREAKDLCSWQENAEILRFAQDDRCGMRGGSGELPELILLLEWAT